MVHGVPSAPMQRIFYEVYRDRAAYDEHQRKSSVTEFDAGPAAGPGHERDRARPPRGEGVLAGRPRAPGGCLTGHARHRGMARGGCQPPRVTLLTRPGCHLCDTARAVIIKVAAGLGVGWTERDITQSADDLATYSDKMPVTLVDGVQHDFWRVSEDRLRTAHSAAPWRDGIADLTEERGSWNERSSDEGTRRVQRLRRRNREPSLLCANVHKGVPLNAKLRASGPPTMPQVNPLRSVGACPAVLFLPTEARASLRPRSPAAGVPAGPLCLRRAGHPYRVERGTRRRGQGELGRAAQGPVPPGLVRHPGVGYDVEYLVYQVSRELGLTQDWPVVIVGAGNLGRALANYGGFASRGFRIAAVLDSDPEVIGSQIAGHGVLDVGQMEDVVARYRVSIGVIATPAGTAQAVCDRLVAAGVTSILNFAPVVLDVPTGVDMMRSTCRSSCRSSPSTPSGGPPGGAD